MIGSVAPSGPILAKYNFTEFFKNFEQVAPASCVSAAQKAVQDIEKYCQSESGLKYLSVCSCYQR